MKLKLKQIAGSTDSATGPVSYLNSYFNSPMFKKRSEGTDYQGQMDYFNQWSSKYKPIVTDEWDSEKKGSAHLVGTGMIRLVKPQARELKSHLYNEILPHEYTHLTRQLPVEDQKLFASREKTPLMKTVLGNYSRFKSNQPDSNMDFNNYLSTNYLGTHDMEPNEQYADLNSLRWMMAKEGIYDTRKGNLDMPTFQKAMSNPKIKDSYMFQRLMKHFSPEDLIKLNNEVAYNSSSGGSNMAQNATKLNPFVPVVPRTALTNQRQYGGSMKQSGGDAYDFGSSVLQNYAQLQQQRQEQASDGQAAQGDETPLYEPQEEQPIQETQQDPNMAIPGADFFAQMQYEYTGNAELQNQLNDMQEQMAAMQEDQALMLSGAFDDSNQGDGEDGSGGIYYPGAGDAGSSNYPSGSGSSSGGSSGGSSSSGAPVTIPKGGGSAAVRYNNPGNIKYSSFSAEFGATKGGPATDGGNFAYFPSIDAGLKAQKALLRGPGYRNLNVTAAMKRWSNNGPYSAKIGKTFGDKLMKDLSDEEMNQLIKMQIQGEDTVMYKKLGYQHGGKVPVVNSAEDKYQGLNNDEFNELLIQNSGYNQYRGLDSGKPVHLYDDMGASAVLLGPDDLATLYGNVYEHR